MLKTRRHFIRQAACAAIGTSALTSILGNLRFVNAAVVQTGISDYKALVCVFLAGGNDSNNLILPTMQADYDAYAAIRTPMLAIPQSVHPAHKPAQQRRAQLWLSSGLSGTADAVSARARWRCSSTPARSFTPHPGPVL